jgi:hypothetical protein
MPKSHDLNALASTALRDIEHAALQREARLRRSPHNASWFKRGVALLVVGTFLYLASAPYNRRFWLGVSEAQQVDEMSAALTAAQLAVDGSYAITKEWPDRVPMPALAALVDLQNAGPHYSLVARTEHWRITLTATGDIQRTRI